MSNPNINYSNLDARYTKPSDISTAVSTQAVTDAGKYASKTVYNVKEAPYGATGNGTTDDTTALQAAIDAAGTAGGGIVFFPAGTYKISSALNVGNNSRHNVTLQGVGSGNYSTGDAPCTIVQSSTTAHGIVSSDTMNNWIKDIKIQGPGSGTGDGIHLTWAVNTNILGFNLDNVMIRGFGGNGISAQSLIVSTIRRVTSAYNGGDGFYFYGGGTSVSFESCFASTNGGNGYNINQMNYCHFSACASDANNVGWLLTNGTTACTISGSGAETNTTDGLVINGVYNVTVSGFGVYSNHRYGVYVLGNSYRVELNNIWETASTGAVYSIYTTGSAITTTFMYGVASPTHFSGFKDTILQDGVLTTPSIVGALTGNADTATKLATTRKINGVSFDGSADITVSDSANSFTSSVSSMPRTAVQAYPNPPSGWVTLNCFTADKSMTVNNLTTICGTAAAATPTLCRLGIYSIDGSNNLTLIGSTANDTTLWSSATSYTKALTSGVAITQGSRYALATLIVSSAAVANLGGYWGVGSEGIVSPMTGVMVNGKSDLPASITAASLSSNVFNVYVRAS